MESDSTRTPCTMKRSQSPTSPRSTTAASTFEDLYLITVTFVVFTAAAHASVPNIFHRCVFQLYLPGVYVSGPALPPVASKIWVRCAFPRRESDRSSKICSRVVQSGWKTSRPGASRLIAIYLPVWQGYMFGDHQCVPGLLAQHVQMLRLLLSASNAPPYGHRCK